jgi:hypothetical protein
MARSDPTRSDYCATRHLLRNLQQPRELRRNPLARDAFAHRSDDEAQRVVAIRVDDALRAMDAQQPFDRRWQGARHAAILLRVDVRRHDPRGVAADLALSSRQFHRERRAAHDRFVRIYRDIGRAIIAGVREDFARRLLERASSLADSGETASARAILDDIACSGGDSALQCEALTRRAEIDAWGHRLDLASAHVNGAQTLLASLRSHERHPELRDAIAAAALALRWFAKGPAAVGGARTNGAGDPVARGPRETLMLAAAAFCSGEAAHASHLLYSLDESAPALRTPEVVVDLLTLRAELADFTAEDPVLSEELFERAESIARASALGGRALYAAHQLALTRWMHSRTALDRSAYRRLVDEIDHSLPPRLRSYLTFSAADVELAIGHPGRALAAAGAAAGVSTNRYESFSAHGLAAGALLRLGRVTEAGAQAACAAEAARAEGHARVLSLAQRISAQAHLATGDRRAARAAIDESIECARKFSSPHVLAQAQAVLGQITGR